MHMCSNNLADLDDALDFIHQILFVITSNMLLDAISMTKFIADWTIPRIVNIIRLNFLL